jgi:hypothetical protein
MKTEPIKTKSYAPDLGRMHDSRDLRSNPMNLNGQMDLRKNRNLGKNRDRNLDLE